MAKQIQPNIRCTKTPKGDFFVFQKKDKNGKAFEKGVFINSKTQEVYRIVVNAEEKRKEGLKKWSNYQEVDPQPYMVKLFLEETTPPKQKKKTSKQEDLAEYQKPHAQQPFLEFFTEIR